MVEQQANAEGARAKGREYEESATKEEGVLEKVLQDWIEAF